MGVNAGRTNPEYRRSDAFRDSAIPIVWKPPTGYERPESRDRHGGGELLLRIWMQNGQVWTLISDNRRSRRLTMSFHRCVIRCRLRCAGAGQSPGGRIGSSGHPDWTTPRTDEPPGSIDYPMNRRAGAACRVPASPSAHPFRACLVHSDR